MHILDHSLPLHSGYAFRTVAILREQRALGYETLQLTTPRQGGGTARFEEAGGWRFYRTPVLPGFLARTPGAAHVLEMQATGRRIDELVDEFAPDILHAHSPVLNVLPSLWIGRRRKLPVVYEVRALWEDAAVDHGVTTEGSVRYRGSRALETYALRHASHVTTICEGLRAEIVARGVPQNRVTVIPNAVDAQEFVFGRSADPALRAELGLEGARVVGFAGSFYSYEGLDLLVDAMAMLTPRWTNLRALLVGGGPHEATLRKQVKACGLEDRVIFTGRIPHAEVQRYYELMDVLAYPRRRMRLTELVTPLKPLEAMAQGRMVIASDVGGHRELVRHGETGFLCEPDDASALAGLLEMVLRNEQMWPRVAEQARRFVDSERTWARSVSGYREVYAGVVGKDYRLCPRTSF
jgi:PEP-CTERM/exosortase A-associated glycosyltransferase